MKCFNLGSSSMDGSPARDASPAASVEKSKSNGGDEEDDGQFWEIDNITNLMEKKYFCSNNVGSN